MMSLLLYLVVLAVSVSSVLFGFGWLSAPEPHYKEPPVQVATHAAAPKNNGSGTLSPIYPAAPKTAQTDASKRANAATKPAPIANAPQAAEAKPAGASTNAAGNNEPANASASDATVTPAASRPACDVQACEAAYRSFDPSDCTYQPYNGPRRFCDKGTPSGHASAADTDAQAQASQTQASTCNLAACEESYRTFNPADCTYQPYNGPRRICEK